MLRWHTWVRLLPNRLSTLLGAVPAVWNFMNSELRISEILELRIRNLAEFWNSPNCEFGIWRNSPNCEFGILRNCGLESCGLRAMVTAVSPSWRRLPAGQRAGSSPWRPKSVIVPLRINKSTTGFYFAFALPCLKADLVRTRHLTLTRMMAAHC